MSKSEDKIEALLKRENISFLREYEIKDLLSYHGNLLRFDFAIFENQKLKCLLEYDSEIHFKQVKYFHKKESDFRQAQERDRIKNKYCLLNNIPLIRIPYWALKDLTIEDIFNNPKYKVTSKFHNDMIC